MAKRKWTIGRIIKLLWVFAGIILTVWIWSAFQAKNISPDTFISNSRLSVSDTEDVISFTPAGRFQKVFIFFPGALVEPEAYAPLCRKIADHGYQAIIIKMPLRMAIRGYEKPKKLNLFADTSKEYILSGHSQGAKMAAQFVYENPGLIDKLILMGTTHPRDINLSNISVPVMKIYGTHDGVAGVKDVNKNKTMLPSNTVYVSIEGGNHSQFGYYGHQFNDDKAAITRDKQQETILEHVLSFIK